MTDELTVLPEEDPKPEGHKPDLSWLVVAVDGSGDGWIMDHAPVGRARGMRRRC